jgi:hypothetical protein
VTAITLNPWKSFSFSGLIKVNRNYHKTLVEKLQQKGKAKKGATRKAEAETSDANPEDGDSSDSDAEEKMDTGDGIPKVKSTGKFPSWLSGKKIQKLAKAKRAQKKRAIQQKKKKKNSRFGT